ncbi:sulfatase-like hydrolase/transferase [Ovoidimarina sediminis]|uniref:sulfatase-like hydrolase/transferase n=1 Tax=Ovoidimarina sediminis TaxID=3079856 RepID=UPI00290EB1E4|nr:sulfatase-like hydrolase/transferase [Rhodophyticola sp. MJ-SS7]MDU8946491.1 sulfatase-like hydrolase/transferase [Rhodophyticola sp. MJ-SS7]
MARRGNILLIVTDHFRGDLLHGALRGAVPLPNLERFAQEAVTFRRHYSVATPCGPSRVSLLTGQYAMNHRAVRNGTPLRHDTPNLARGLRERGYDPLLFGYTDVTQDPRVLAPDDPRLFSYEEVLPGFTEVVRMRQETDDRVWRDHLRSKGYDVPEGMALYRPVGGRIDGPALYRAEDSDTAFLTDRFLGHMETVEDGWAAMLSYIRPHPPFVAPDPWNGLVAPEDVPAPAEADEGVPPHPYVAALRATKSVASLVSGFPDLASDPDVIRRLRAVFLGLAAEVDHHVGRVFDWLRSTNRLENTLVVFTADHGDTLGDYGLWGKDSFYDAAFHVPLIIRAPGHGARVVEAMTESIDVAPTLLDWAGCDVPHSMDGRSLLGTLETGKGGREITFSEHDFGNPVSATGVQRQLGLHADAANFAVLRTGAHRLVHFASGLPQVVFDVRAGSEARDLAGTGEAGAISLDLSVKMLCLRMQNPEGTFSRTLVTRDGVQIGSD